MHTLKDQVQLHQALMRMLKEQAPLQLVRDHTLKDFQQRQY
jgi:hypothetical protein